MKQQVTDLLTRLQRLNKQQILDRLHEMDPSQFDHLIMLIFERRGYQASIAENSGDEGVDIRLRKNRSTAVAQCKHKQGSVGQPVVRDLYGTMLHDSSDEAFLVTTAQITRQAREWAFGKPITFVDGFTLTQWILEVAQQPPNNNTRTANPFSFSGDSSSNANLMSEQHTSNDISNGSAESERGGMRFWFWPLVVLAILFFGIAIGVAYNRLAPRWASESTIVVATPNGGASNDNVAADAAGENGGSNDDASEPTVGSATTSNEATDGEAEANTTPQDEVAQAASPTAAPPTEVPAATLTPTVTPTAPPTEAPTATRAPTLAPTATWTPESNSETQATSCPIAVDGEFEPLHNANVLGCPTSTTGLHWAAWQAFERGYLLWRSDTDAAYSLYGPTQGTWFQIPERWDGAATAPRGEPPSTNLVAPERGFGYVWGIRDDIFENIGWATDIEKGFCALIQPYEQGFIMQSIAVDSCTSEGLFNQARAADWRPITIIASADGQFTIE